MAHKSKSYGMSEAAKERIAGIAVVLGLVAFDLFCAWLAYQSTKRPEFSLR